MRILLDAMGGDHAPQVTVEGGVWAARDFGVEVVLVGREEDMRAELAKHQTSGLPLTLVHASEVVEMEEHPAMAVRTKRDSSMVVGMKMLKQGEVDAFVSMGNTGGVLTAALLHLGRIPGVMRPALSTVYPTIKGFCFMLDVGANTDCRPQWLQQFALMGSIYTERVLGVERPKVGLVSNGEEETKGNQLVQEAHQLLKETPGIHFVGNVEGKDIAPGMADVVVTDGFTGNVIIKLSEGLAWMFKAMVREELKRSPASLLGGLLARGAFDGLADRLDYAKYGGAPLLGVDGVVIIGHGRSNALAVRNAIRVAKQAVESQVIATIKEGLAAAGVRRGEAEPEEE
ncbi:MAG: phosphate acyltransferase PlsX [Anaerolineae bacterium]|nr:phosphate acyltransferase PlsX [Anaerolineae bacterium]